MRNYNIENMIEIGKKRGLITIDDQKITYTHQQKEYVFSDPEEQVRAAVYVELVTEYEYSPYCIDLEVNVPRRTPNDYADIVVYTDEDFTDNYIVIETKRVDITDNDFSQGIEQGFGNANSLRSDLLIIDSFSTRKVFNISDFPPNERNENLIADIPENYGLIPEYLYSRSGEVDLAKVSFDELASIFQKCHDIIWSGGKLDPSTAFDEMSKLLFAKISDERRTPNRESYYLQVGTNENEVAVANRVRKRYQTADIDREVFNEDINLSDLKIKSAIQILQRVSLLKTDLDAKGQAFEKFLGVVFRGELGQYFTRRQIVEFVVSYLEPTSDDKILDPSCGSGGFLLYSMMFIIDNIRQNFSGNPKLISENIHKFKHNNIFGIEINSKISRVAKMDMIVNEDGYTNIECGSGLDNTFSNPDINNGDFSLIMTNPPFGVKIRRNDRDNLGNNSFDNFTFAQGRKTQLSDILFLEKYKEFLTSDITRNPRAGIVLQTGVLNNPSNRDVLTWLKCNFKITGVINLPIFSFRKAGSGMKTCLLFLEKYSRPYNSLDEIPNYEVFFAIAEHIGYDPTLRPDDNDFPIILNHYKNNTENRDIGIFWLNFHDLDYRLDPIYYQTKFIVSNEFEQLQANGHQLVSLGDILIDFKSGKSPDGGVTRSVGEYPSITISNITEDGTLSFKNTINFVPEDFYHDFNETRGKLKYHDILIAKDGATTGKTAIIDENFDFLIEDECGEKNPYAIYSEHVFRLTVKPNINAGYVNAFLNSSLGQMQLDMITSGGGQGGITRNFVDNIFIPLLDEQTQNSIADQWNKKLNRITHAKSKYLEMSKNISVSIYKAISGSNSIPEEDIEDILFS